MERNTPSPEPPSVISRSPSRWAQPRLPNWAPIKRDSHPQSLPFITYRYPDKGAPSPGSPKWSSHRERCPVRRAPFQLFLRVPSEWTYPSSESSSLCPSGSPEGSPQWSSHKERCSPSRALPKAPSMEPLERAIPHPQSPFIQLSKSPVDEPSSRFPKSGAPMKRDARLQSLF
jgi:hypothetical protein